MRTVFACRTFINCNREINPRMASIILSPLVSHQIK
jgi:hypothetical protein